MDKESKDKLKGTLIVPVGLSVILVPFSMFIGWGLITLILFWLVLTPMLTIFLPKLVSSSKNQLFESVVGLLIFYAAMVFMIYEHYKSDYFQVMMVSCLANVIIVCVISWARKPSTQTQ